MNKFEDDLYCEICKNKIKDISICLPCGFLVCEKHLRIDFAQVNCFVCENHQINIQECLNMPRNKKKLDKIKLNKEKSELDAKIEKFKQIKLDPVQFVNENFQDMLQKIDLKREELKMQIDNRYNELLIQIKDQKSKAESKLIESIGKLRTEDLLATNENLKKKLRIF